MNKPIITIFGGTGDLTYRKLLPAFYNLLNNDSLPAPFHIVVVGRQPFTSTTYHEEIIPWLKKYSRYEVKPETLTTFLEMVSYFEMNFTEDEGYPQLKEQLQALAPKTNLLYYFAVAPSFFEIIAHKLHHNGMAENNDIIIEKPFGNDLQSAIAINTTLTSIFGEEHIYRIDHYVAKEMVQNIFKIRFANMLFKDTWRHEAIQSVQISANETVGVENRGGYYDHTGALKDMVQNHLLQILSIVAMEEPEDSSATAIHQVQEDVLEAIHIRNVQEDIVCGQYEANQDSKAYLDEENVASDSSTETFVALRLEINNERWQKTPFYIRTGKRLHKRSTEVVIEFKPRHEEKSNVLIIKIQPDEGVYLRFNIKKPGTTQESQTVFMDFCQSCKTENRINSPESYERLLAAAMDHDHSLFTSFKIVTLSWEFVEAILQQTTKKPANYPAYTNGPFQSHELLYRDGNAWIEEDVLGELYED